MVSMRSLSIILCPLEVNQYAMFSLVADIGDSPGEVDLRSHPGAVAGLAGNIAGLTWRGV